MQGTDKKKEAEAAMGGCGIVDRVATIVVHRSALMHLARITRVLSMEQVLWCLCVYMCVCSCVHVCTCMCERMCVHVWVCLSMCKHVFCVSVCECKLIPMPFQPF